VFNFFRNVQYVKEIEVKGRRVRMVTM